MSAEIIPTQTSSGQGSLPQTPISGPNSIETLKDKVRNRHIRWTWPLIMTFIRFPLLLLGLFIMLGYYTSIGHAQPFLNALAMANVYTTLTADVGCFLLLLWLTRREGMRLRDLIGFRHTLLVRDILIGLGFFVILFVSFIMTNLLSTLIVYGPSVFQASPTTQATGAINPNPLGLPLWYFWWATLVLPLSVAFMEEMTYRAYALPRLVALTNRPWLAVVIMSLGFGVQHIAFALTSW